MYVPNDNIKYSMTGSTTLQAGSFEIAPCTHWSFNYKPNWRTRTMARIFLGSKTGGLKMSYDKIRSALGILNRAEDNLDGIRFDLAEDYPEIAKECETMSKRCGKLQAYLRQLHVPQQTEKDLK